MRKFLNVLKNIFFYIILIVVYIIYGILTCFNGLLFGLKKIIEYFNIGFIKLKEGVNKLIERIKLLF